jgi:tetratricopeptide (TPR) repeat protein
MRDVLELGDLALGSFDGQAALAVYDQYLSQDHQDPAMSARAAAGGVRALWVSRRWSEARDRLDALAHINDSVYVWLARGVVALGQPDALSWLAIDCGSGQRNDEEAIAAFEAAIDQDPNCGEAVAGKTTALRMARRRREARDFIEPKAALPNASVPVLIEAAMCAAEDAEFDAAKELANRAIAADPTSLHARSLGVELLRLERQGSAEAIERARALMEGGESPSAVALGVYGWALYERGEAVAMPSLRERYLNHAHVAFRRSMAVGPVLPGVVSGAVEVHLADYDLESAREIVLTAIERDPASPHLQLSLAKIVSADGGDAQTRLDAYQKVLDRDPRDLSARVAAAEVHLELDQQPEAQELIDQLYDEVPAAYTNWDESLPWKQASKRTRIEKPWKGRKDRPQVVLDVLEAEAVRRLRLRPDAEGRLRARLSSDPQSVLEQGYATEQEYLRLRKYRESLRYDRFRAMALKGGWVLVAFCTVATVFGVGLVVWLLSGLAPISTGWRLSLVVGIPVVVALITWLLDEFLWVDILSGVGVATVVAAATAFIWQAILAFGAGLGVVVGVIACGIVVGAFLLGFFLVDEFESDPDEPVQDAFDDWLEVLYRKGVEPAATEAINRPGRVYGTHLGARGRLGSTEPAALETAAAADLRRQLRRSSGSFALAGPRGAGKSTLLERWCDGQFLRGADQQLAPRRDLSIQVRAPVGYQSQDFLIHLFSSTCRKVEKYAKQHESAWEDTTSWEQRAERSAASVRRVVASGASAARHSDRVTGLALAKLARQERESIRSVVSRMTEGEASVGLSGVASAKGRSSTRRDELPLNHPELVDRFREFLRLAADAVNDLGGKVLVGIDELDRISDGKAAQTFINELKAVFGIDNCYFLVSVSEDALAEFELAAMGTRTVFDSAFDSIMRVDYLTFDEARVVLQRRVPDVTEQFVALAYVLSGALVRQLCRVADEMAGDRRHAERGLSAVAAGLVGRQVRDVTRAAMDLLSRSHSGSGAQLIPVLDVPPTRNLTPTTLREFAAQLAACDLSGDESGATESVRRDVVVRMEFFAVILEVFDDSLDKERMELGRDATIGNFDTLARARRYAGAFPDGASELVDAFANEWGIAARDRTGDREA